MMNLATFLLAAIVIPDIPYSSPGAASNCGPPDDANEPCNSLDVWLADDPLPDAPTVLWIHGGGWQLGDKSGVNSSEVAQVWTAAGYNCVSANFTLSEPEGAAPSWPQVIYDLKAVVAWIRTEGADFGLSPHISACGNSSGGHLAQLLATTADVLNPPEVAAPPICEGFRIQAAQSVAGEGDLTGFTPDASGLSALNDMLGTDWDGGANIPPTVLEASPAEYVDPTDSPMASYHGLDDNSSPVETDIWFHDALEAADVYNVLHLTPGGHNWGPWGGREATVALWVAELPSLLEGDRAPQDINRDGCVDTSDLVIFLASYGGCDGCCADFNDDDSVDTFDLLLLLQAWGCD